MQVFKNATNWKSTNLKHNYFQMASSVPNCGGSSQPKSSSIVCTQCHCQQCFQSYSSSTATTPSQTQTGTDAPRASSLSRPRSGFRSHFKDSGSAGDSGSVVVPWTEGWFKELVDFRKRSYWDCHAETTKIWFKSGSNVLMFWRYFRRNKWQKNYDFDSNYGHLCRKQKYKKIVNFWAENGDYITGPWLLQNLIKSAY
jgi:hypothetical protein